MRTLLDKIANTLPMYVLFLIPFLVIGPLIWMVFVNGKLYYCSDKVPVLDFIPPFVHGSQTGDYWIADPKLVWIIWFLLIGLILFFPYLLAKKLESTKNTKK